MKRQLQADGESNKYQTPIEQEAKNNQENMHQIQESINKMLLFQKGLQEAGSITSKTSNSKNRSNESNATRESFKRKSDTLMKAKNNIEPKKLRLSKLGEPIMKEEKEL